MEKRRYAILTHEAYDIDFETVDDWTFALQTNRIYFECEAATPGQAKMQLLKEYHRSHVEFTDGMSIRLMQPCECGGVAVDPEHWDCLKCGGHGWFVPGGFKQC